MPGTKSDKQKKMSTVAKTVYRHLSFRLFVGEPIDGDVILSVSSPVNPVKGVFFTYPNKLFKEGVT